MEALDAAVPHIEEWFADKPEVQVELRLLIGSVYSSHSRFHDAYDQFERAHAISGQSLGPDSSLALQSLNDMVAALLPMGKFEEAEPLAERAVQQSREGEETHWTALENKARLLLKTERATQAQPLFQAVLQHRNNAADADPRLLYRAEHNYGSVLLAMGQPVAAEECLRRALDGREKLLSRRHPERLDSVQVLAEVLLASGKLDESVRLFKEAVNVRMEVNGPIHPGTVAAMLGLGRAYLESGQREHAQYWTEQAVNANRDRREQPSVAIRGDVQLVEVYLASGDLLRADRLARGALEQAEIWLAETDRVRLAAEAAVATVQHAYGETEKAEAALRHVRDELRTKYGADDPDAIRHTNRLGLVLMDMERFDEALAELSAAVKSASDNYGADHTRTAFLRGDVAACLQEMGRTQTALDELKKCWEVIADTPGLTNPRTHQVARQLIDIYKQTDRPGLADELQAKLDANPIPPPEPLPRLEPRLQPQRPPGPFSDPPRRPPG
jgi:tetratricopeptide (TPR) repeat protein